jgi:hypothetical protein
VIGVRRSCKPAFHLLLEDLQRHAAASQDLIMERLDVEPGPQALVCAIAERENPELANLV